MRGNLRQELQRKVKRSLPAAAKGLQGQAAVCHSTRSFRPWAWGVQLQPPSDDGMHVETKATRSGMKDGQHPSGFTCEGVLQSSSTVRSTSCCKNDAACSNKA